MGLSKERKKQYCKGCHDDIYNYGAGGATECIRLKDAKIVWLKEVHINDRPPWHHKAKRFPDCYRKPKFIYVEPHKKY